MKIFPITGKRLAMLALVGAASFLSSVSAQPAPDQPAPAVRNGAVASESQPLVLAPPLRDAYWAVIYGPDAVHCNPPLWPRPAASTHGCTVTDWFKVDFDGHRRKDGIDVPADWLSYGETVLAGADAIVSKVVSDVPEPADVKPDGSTPDAAGNYVSLDMGGNRRVFYEYLKAGSIPVRAGQKVRRGEVIGRVGYSGNAIGPHLRMRVDASEREHARRGSPTSSMTSDGSARLARSRISCGNVPGRTRPMDCSEPENDPRPCPWSASRRRSTGSTQAPYRRWRHPPAAKLAPVR